MKKGIIYRGTNVLGYAGWPSVAKLEDGTIAAVFSGDRLKHVCPFGKSMISYSRDGGNTWSPAAAVVNTAFDDRDAGITVKGKQVIVSSFNNNYAFQRRDRAYWNGREGRDGSDLITQIMNNYMDLSKDANEDDVGSSIAISEDGGYTFPTRIMMPITAPHGPIVLNDGRYFYVGRSFQVSDEDKTPGRVYNELPEGIYFMTSEDGYKWSGPKAIYLTPKGSKTLYCEPHAIQLKNGEVMVHIRVQGVGTFNVLRTYQTVSSNNMTAWSTPEDIGVIGSPPHLFRHSSGVIIDVIGRREKPYAEVAILSYDEGKTWSKEYVIDGDTVSDDMGYPATCELDDGSLLTVYYQHDEAGARNDIKYTIWKLEELK